MAQALDKYRINPGSVGAKRHDEHFQTIVEAPSSMAACSHRRQLGLTGPGLLTELMDANARGRPQDAREVMIEGDARSAGRPSWPSHGLGHDRIVLGQGQRRPDLVDVYRLLAALRLPVALA
jgi:(E)-4-hydroxy-3-methylbut-2-enyl-diphosphate synthase